MSSGISETARHIADSAQKFARDSGGVQRARAMRDRSTQLDVQVWRQIADLGWLGIRVAEQHGGLGLDAGAAAALWESVGTVLFPEPVVSAIAAAGLLSDCATESSIEMLAQLVSGKRLFIPANALPSNINGDAADASLKLSHVADCHENVSLLVACHASERFEIRAVDLQSRGVSMLAVHCVDGSVLSTVTIAHEAWNRAAIVAQGAGARAAFDRATDMMLLGYSAYLVGLMHEALQIALEYMKVRTQFGTAIGSFQALQHRAASCHVDIVSSRALLVEAARAFDTPERARAAAAVKARTSAAALRVTKECVQFHGAIGFADEHDIGLYLRKAMTVAARQGGEAKQKLRFLAAAHGARQGAAV
jgi:alkylation response protein AidB-like acyl-CoA dehydrogenase